MNMACVQPCPYCKKSTVWENNPWRPFCSERCRLMDLGSWASGAYRIPGEPLKSEKDEEDAVLDDKREKT